jgi:hypothetical protein
MSANYSKAWETHARFIVERFGYVEAHRMASDGAKRNASGTFSHAFHVATLACLERFATVGRVTP